MVTPTHARTLVCLIALTTSWTSVGCCCNKSNRSERPDPFFGPKCNAPGGSASNSPASNPCPTTPASLASGWGRPLDPKCNLQIPDSDNRLTSAQPEPVPQMPCVKLNAPIVPVSDPQPDCIPPPVQPVSSRGVSSATCIASFEEGQRALKAKGVTWQQISTTECGDWKVVVSVPCRPTARRYEATDPNGVRAVQLVLDQIEKDGR